MTVPYCTCYHMLHASGIDLLQKKGLRTSASWPAGLQKHLRAVKNTSEDRALVLGDGAFELAGAIHLRDVVTKRTQGRPKLGVEVYTEALLVFSKTLAENSGFDVQDCLLNLADAREASWGTRRR